MNGALPTVDLEFLISLIEGSSKIEGSFQTGQTRTFIMKGSSFIGKRMILVRGIDGSVEFDFAMGIAIKLKCQGELLEWLKINRSWKDGAYLAS